ncbi:carbon-monoxide dehydrogenase catalytic subunit [Sporomusaceae bacterium BoRhaA]|uniref:anaerobic carbon-monoxide dehydrogenase catalytic subunit n=1 Tax=Pelorhabdus rhamnosifermentans TaxID=2772457 RepID=UPI001C06428C|nr:anaerobic carbon-monoxide dehydrogenase catalytic subunit [Pelorhabdus rhamnosifermentans]MBU2703111.1 carbon-monoxide dehydrogenase catalytic subunit [Pelorhabdus rhamnosifermentans]
MSEMEFEKFSVDPAARQMLVQAKKIGYLTSFDRAKAQEPKCKFGNTGICCRICMQGPCRIIPQKLGANKGICGAQDYTIVARNTVRLIAGGAAAHSDHGRHIATTVLHVAEGHAKDYKITDEAKLMKVAERIGIETAGKSANEVAKGVATEALKDFGRQENTPCTWTKTTITEGRKQKFYDTAIMPSSINGSIAELLHQTHVGNDSDPVNIIFGGLKAALSDYDGMQLATDLSDVLFGTPVPVISEANLGVLDPEMVNICVHGHNPLLSQIIVSVAREMQEEAKAVGSKGIKLSGICCTGNEVLGREGIAIATNFATQELAIMTGLVDAIVVDVQCIMPSLRSLSECFHTKVVTTMPISKIPGSYHVEFDEEHAVESARTIIRLAIETFKSRDPNKVNRPDLKNKVIAGFSLEAILDIFGSVNAEHPVSVLTDAIKTGEIKGVALFCGCNNLKGVHNQNHLGLAKKLAANDVFMISTGCAGQAYAMDGLLTHEAVEAYAGLGLKKFLQRIGEKANLKTELPLIFHMGSCVDNSRASNLLTLMAQELGVDTPAVPFVASAPEPMSEKAVAIGSWNVAMGIPVHIGVIAPVTGSDLVHGVLTKIAKDVFGGYFIMETDYEKAAKKLLAALDERAWKFRVRSEAIAKYATNE